MTTIDNTELIASLIDEQEDPDTFWYTELIDRRVTKGSDGLRILRSFEHRCRAHFLERAQTIRRLCEVNGVRAYTRLSPRSRKAVAKDMLTSTLQMVLEERYAGLRGAYASSCGRVAIHGRKLWLYDCDEGDVGPLRIALRDRDVLVALIPSKSGLHLVCKPHKVDYETHHQLQKDGPTNLYVPEGAE